MKTICRILWIKHHLSTLYYHQPNRRPERAAGTIITIWKRAVQEPIEGCRNDGEWLRVCEDNIRVDIDIGVIEAIRDVWQGNGPIAADRATEKSKSVDWATLLSTMLWAYRCYCHMYSPAMLALGKKLQMRFDLDKANEHTKTDTEHRLHIASRIKWLTVGIRGL